MTIRITVDAENNAERFWESLQDAMPDVAERLRRDNTCLVTEDQWTAIKALDGFSDGPEHAKDALIGTTDSSDLPWVVCWGFFGRVSQDAMQAATAVAEAMERQQTTKITAELIADAVEHLGGYWDAKSLESLIDGCAFERIR